MYFWHVRPTKTQISLGIRLFVCMKTASLFIKNTLSSVQTAWMCRLTWIFAGHTYPRVRFLMLRLLYIVRLSLLTMTSSKQLWDVLLFVCSKMADETNLSSKLPVADRTRKVWGRKLCWWCLSSGFPLCTFLLGFVESFCFVFTSSPSYEASPLCSILCNLVLRLCV